MLGFFRKKKSFAILPDGSSIIGSLPELFVFMYGLDHFSICYDKNCCKHSLDFDFDREFYKNLSSLSLENLYDSVFYTFVSMCLTRSERDKFIKLFRRS